MRRSVPVAVAALFLSACSNQQQVPGPVLAFEHVSVIDVRNGTVTEDQVLTISANRIMEVGATGQVRIPSGARVVNATGKFAIPGLWDMHVHIVDPDTPGDPDVTLPLFVANGVTGIRDLGSSDLDSILTLRTAVRAGERIGPRMQLAGKVIDGNPIVFPPDTWLARTPDEARHFVDSLSSRGLDVVKAYEMLQRDVFLALVDRAKQLGLPVVAHVPLAFDANEVSSLRVRSLEHLRNIELACSAVADSLRLARTERLQLEAAKPDTGSLAFDWSLGYGPGALIRAAIHREQRLLAHATRDSIRCSALLRSLALNGTWQTPTLFMIQRVYLRVDTIPTVRSASRYVPANSWDLWESDAREASEMTAEARATLEQQGKWHLELVSALREAGVGILAGTDVSNPYMIPGFSLHEELAMLVLAGLSPLEALQAATLNPALYMNAADSLGLVQAGFVADIVLLDSNPLSDIANVRRVTDVVLNGRYFDRAALDSLLVQAEVAARR